MSSNKSSSREPQERLRIAIEARRIFNPYKRGMDVVALEMIRQLQRMDTYNEYFILTRKDADVCLSETANFHIVYLTGFCYPVWEQLSLPKWVRRNKPDILHCMSNTAPLHVRCPLFLTLHDLAFLERNVGTLPQRLGNIYRSMVAPRAARRAKVVFTVSKYQKESIKQRLRLPDEKVKVVYNGVPSRFFEQAQPDLRWEVQQTYGLPSRFILFLGNTETRKNLKGVLSAYAMLPEMMDEDIPDLVVSGVTPRHLAKVLRHLGLASAAPRIKEVGYISASHLPVVYQMAEMLLFPSYSEGFGLPIIEAMASGIPVVTSNVTAMPEVAGDAALLVSPSLSPNIAKAMELLLTTVTLRAILVQKGLERVKHFGGPEQAQKVLSSYLCLGNSAVASGSPEDANHYAR
ncbi:glycosyltransferase family 1 protein [uncultured Acetobacteroides sp.]|uniref:glycosyltransferase family 4 protein n=1 Tax=uncultured Acetobacteroides sp. TaxID=1760811 RepID=UPI0029F557C7|nr:glycosyltransferase family 1 protein [uncultured Acetobacteroides sp.]